MFPRPNSDAIVRDVGKRTTQTRTAGTKIKPAIHVEKKATSDACAEIKETLRKKESMRKSSSHVKDGVKMIRDEYIIWMLEGDKVSRVQIQRKKCHCIR